MLVSSRVNRLLGHLPSQACGTTDRTCDATGDQADNAEPGGGGYLLQLSREVAEDRDWETDSVTSLCTGSDLI